MTMSVMDVRPGAEGTSPRTGPSAERRQTGRMESTLASLATSIRQLAHPPYARPGPDEYAWLALCIAWMIKGPGSVLVHPGGPLFRNKDKGVWSLPKGLADDGEVGEQRLEVAKSEFEEETGVKPSDRLTMWALFVVGLIMTATHGS